MSLTALNRQRGAFKTKVNKIGIFIKEFEPSDDSKKDTIQLSTKLTSVNDILRGLDQIKCELCALPDDLDLKDVLEFTIELEEDAQEMKLYFIYILRFIKNSKSPSDKRITGPFTHKELIGAEVWLLNAVQKIEFSSEFKNLLKGKPVPCNSKLASLNCFIDENSIIRVGGRLQNSSLSFNEKCSIMLPIILFVNFFPEFPRKDFGDSSYYYSVFFYLDFIGGKLGQLRIRDSTTRLLWCPLLPKAV
ncbi:hypothetical protein HNY73_005895 [Argiope bruennichi]|uniref:Uncharacterized protein n=1 Tax=Argiope bruennichi TaxID=94029 RepID=A0A8T0FJ48_ARGBR|nr:hypothetical protein HNY73_005895 [Argiope bruennichi]